MAIKKITGTILKSLNILPITIILFFSLAHHLFSIWERSAVSIAVFVVLGIPLLFLGLNLLFNGNKIDRLFHDWKKNRLMLFLAILLGFFGAYRVIESPKVFHSITITPGLDTTQVAEIIELKVNGDVIPLAKQAVESNWEVRDYAIAGSVESQPLHLSAFAPVGVPCDLLFYTLPEGGQITIMTGMTKIHKNLSSLAPEQISLEFKTGYRGIPYWLFIPFLFLMDWAAFSFLIYCVFRLYKYGEWIEDLAFTNNPRLVNHRRNILILVSLSVILHVCYALSVPLILDVDSPTYLNGAVYWIQNGTLDGVSSLRGPGTTFLFAPFLLLFGRNPWGLKIFLHLLGIGCVLLAYLISWQLSNNSRLSFLTGFITFLIPDLYYASTYVMSDLANIFFVLLFCLFVLIALKRRTLKWYLWAFFEGSFLVLLRPENLVVLCTGIFAVGIQPLWVVLKKFSKKESIGIRSAYKDIGIIGISALLAFLPIFWWCMHNYYHQDYFGLSNYSGQVLYDGWIYYGDASGLHFSNKESEAVQIIDNALLRYPAQISDNTGVATGAEIFSSLSNEGYSRNESMALLQTAVMDSIRKDWRLTMRLLWIKIGDALRPEIPHSFTFPLPGEPPIERPIEPLYFDAENVHIPVLILSTRWVYQRLDTFYWNLYPYWVWICLACLLIVLLRRPNIQWPMLVFITFTRLFIPLLMSVANWRYTTSAIVLLQIITINCIYLICLGMQSASRKPIAQLNE
jgi:4-amino-4-deoxy-L-arabinose transferase-like glycosyltransferase